MSGKYGMEKTPHSPHSLKALLCYISTHVIEKSTLAQAPGNLNLTSWPYFIYIKNKSW